MAAFAAALLFLPAASASSEKLHPAMEHRLREVEAGEPVKAWVMFQRDKGHASQAELDVALDELSRSYDPHAIERRTERRTRPGLFDLDDLPLPEPWLQEVRGTGARIVVTSRWAAAVSVLATEEQILALADLPVVRRIRPVLRGARREPGRGPDLEPAIPVGNPFYGETQEQLEQMNLTALHALGYTGLGMRIGVLDTGFRTTHEAFNTPGHPLNVVAEWDFVNDDPVTAPEPGDLPTQHDHGTWILGTMAAYRPGTLVGAAYDASYILTKVEDLAAEYPAEEDMFVAGLEFIEANGGDIATSSVVIFNFYTQDDLDGETTVMSQGLNVAAANGLHVCQGAGNDGHDSDPATSSLVPPADAFQTITVGAVGSSGEIAGFSSDGPTADGRLKPEVLARGVNTRTVSSTDDMATVGVSGTSLSTPLLAGASACVLQAHPSWSVDQLRTHLFLNADLYQASGAPDPLYVHGFGIIDALASFEEDCNGNDIEDSLDLGHGTSGDCNANGIPDECDVAALVSPDDAVDGLPDECTECQTGPGCPAEVDGLLLSKQFPDVILSWQTAPDAAEYAILRDPTAQGAGATTVGQTTGPELSWIEADGLIGPPPAAFYLVRGVTGGGVSGP
jgi:hypothetical protein